MTVELEPRHIIKRDGSIRDFDADKIVIAIAKAGKATGEITAEGAKRLTETEVMPRIRALKTETPDIEKVQDAVEQSIFAGGFSRRSAPTSFIASSMRNSAMRSTAGLMLSPRSMSI